MKIIIRNNAKIPKKYIRFIKWKMYNVKEKFNHLIYAEVHLKSEGHSPKVFQASVRLGIPGNDIIIQSKSKDLNEIFKKSTQSMHRYLAKSKVAEY